MFFYLIETILYGFALYLLWVMTFEAWLKYKRAEFVNAMKWVMIEIRLPREIDKSPAAMEVALEAFAQGSGVGTWWDKYRKGNLLNWFSLEIASFGGDIRFFIRTPERFKNLIESYIYSQYPGVEIFEVEDYTNRIRFDAKDHNLFGAHIVLSKDDALPIKTYVDFGLGDNPKEEYKVDPMTPMLEYFGTLKGNQEAWFQILIRSDKQKDWKKEAKDAVANLMAGRSYNDKGDGEKEEIKAYGDMRLSQTQKDLIKAIERSATKTGFEVFMRAIYIAPKDEYDRAGVTGLQNMLKAFNNPSLNGFSIQDDTGFAFPWQEKFGTKGDTLKQRIFKKYVLRTFGEYASQFDNFTLQYEIQSRWDKLLRHGYKYGSASKGKSSFVLNAEELATIYHFPGKVSGTPTFKRISSTKSEAPNNLPI